MTNWVSRNVLRLGLGGGLNLENVGVSCDIFLLDNFLFKPSHDF